MEAQMPQFCLVVWMWLCLGISINSHLWRVQTEHYIVMGTSQSGPVLAKPYMNNLKQLWHWSNKCASQTQSGLKFSRGLGLGNVLRMTWRRWRNWCLPMPSVRYPTSPVHPGTRPFWLHHTMASALTGTQHHCGSTAHWQETPSIHVTQRTVMDKINSLFRNVWKTHWEAAWPVGAHGRHESHGDPEYCNRGWSGKWCERWNHQHCTGPKGAQSSQGWGNRCYEITIPTCNDTVQALPLHLWKIGGLTRQGDPNISLRD